MKADTWLLICIITLFFYTILVLFTRFGWYRIRNTSQQNHLHDISLLIPFRNESAHLRALISCLCKLDYPSNRLEIVFIDDHSSDESVEIVKNGVFGIPFPCKIISLQEGAIGKRAALCAGIEASTFNQILTTDADCSMLPGWVRSMSSGMQGAIRLVCGPVRIVPGNSFFHKLQELELMPVMAVSAGLAGIGLPVMANGANMLFRKDDFLSYLKKELNIGASGDDNRFLLFLKQHFPGSVSFQALADCVVFTNPTSAVRDFIQQRQRWTSKSRHYRDPVIISLGGLIAWINLLLFLTGLMSTVFPALTFSLLLLLAGKTILDILLLQPVLSFFNSARLLRLVPVLELVYPFYSTLLLALVFRRGYDWKGRRFS
jgi:cellulose synthase/poly-beta-1,6-N-acetylglucosamine synthase-like glycosyltransferase